MSGVQAGMDFGMMLTGANRIGQAAEAFERGYLRVGGVSPAVAPRPQATDLLDRLVDALTGALRSAGTELGHHSAALTDTVGSYQQAEAALANWQVPGQDG